MQHGTPALTGESAREQGLAVVLGRMESVLVRFVSLVLLFLAIRYWMRVTGYYTGTDFRFDTMSEHWRIASASLSVLLPVAALGLWGRFSWGMVVWFLAVVQQVAMHTWFAQLFGRADMIVGFHLTTLFAFLGLELAARLFARRARQK